MAFFTVLLLSFATACLYLLWKYRTFSMCLDHVPGPKGVPFIGNAIELKKPEYWHREFVKLKQRYGPVVKIRLAHLHVALLTSFEVFQECLIKKGQQTSGRASTFRTRFATMDTGILLQSKADNVWKVLRKLSQQHLKQFGEGMTRLEYLIMDIAEDMFNGFSKASDEPLDPKELIFDTALHNIAFIILGQRLELNDPLLTQMKEHEPRFMRDVAGVASLKHLLIDAFPPCRFLFPGCWKGVLRLMELEDTIWGNIKEKMEQRPESEGLAKLLLSQINIKDAQASVLFPTERDAKQTCMSLLLAGVATTSQTFYALVNILAHNEDIQEKLYQQLQDVVGDRRVLLEDRPDLPYVMATLLELLRYFPVVAHGVGHEVTDDNTILQGYHLPKGTHVWTSVWTLHNDPEFWGDPEVFCPERFLDHDGQLLPADDPKRKHVIPFGSGPRVCLGESFAKARLFLWLTGLVQRLKVIPAEGNNKNLTEHDSYYCESILYSPSYEVRFIQRS